MKRNRLAGAVLAGLTGVAGMVSVSHAVNLNPDGLGQVLLYPYYSARGGNDTLISVVNTTSAAKAVKVRFIEGLNSREVLDFNVYMSPFDVWAAAVTDVTPRAAGGFDPDPDGRADLVIPDTTCTSPFLFDPVTQNADEGLQRFLTIEVDGETDRTLSGHIEIIEMGTLVDVAGTDFTPATWATHTDNPDFDPADPDSGPRFVPIDCAAINRQWSTVLGVDGVWRSDEPGEGASVGIDPASGGLFGGGSVVNVADGTMFSYNATAIDAFYTATGSDHTFPGSLEPSLIGDPTGVQPITNTESNIFVDGTVQTADWSNAPSDLGTLLALNATITRETVLNEYVYGGGTNARTEWLLTFPTKTFHVNGDDPVAPFTELFGADDCEPVFFERNLFNREEQTSQPGSDGPVVSPQEPGDDPQEFELCFESQVVRFGAADEFDELSESELFKEPTDRVVNIDPVSELGFNTGWARLSFNPIAADGSEIAGAEVHESLPSDGGSVYQGLPVIGFSVTKFSNGTLVDDETGESVRANYAGSFMHRGTRRITFEEIVEEPTGN